jgi:hypothetical protein
MQVIASELRCTAVRITGGDPERLSVASASPGCSRQARAFGTMPARLNGFLAETAASARERFAGPLTYASGMWEPVDWQPFDIAATDAYRDATNAPRFRAELSKQARAGKPLVVTEFGCCGYAGAADRGGTGWAIIEPDTDPPRLDGDYVRDEAEQVRYMQELHAIFGAEDVDLAFWFTFAGYGLAHRPGQPRLDLDMASYGVVKMLEAGPPAGYQGLGWEPKAAFGALAQLS